MAECSYYKSFPLVRKGNEIYYGYMGDPYVIMMQILHSEKGEKISEADKIKVYQISTKNNLPTQNAERESLYDALDLAYTWLKRSAKSK